MTNFSSRILSHPLESVCLPLVAEETFAQLVGYCRYGRSKVVEVFRRLRDGDPVEIEKNFRCSSDNLVVQSMSTSTGITNILVAGKEMFVQG